MAFSASLQAMGERCENHDDCPPHEYCNSGAEEVLFVIRGQSAAVSSPLVIFLFRHA